MGAPTPPAATRSSRPAGREATAARAAVPSPARIAAALGKRVLGQQDAVREVSVALAKKLANLRVGNILLVGSSGSGKTTLMHAVEDLLGLRPRPRLGAPPSSASTPTCWAPRRRKAAPARRCCTGSWSARVSSSDGTPPIERVVAQASHGLVFVDEVDKIRSRVGDQVQVSGIRAQEALLTLIENETVPVRLPGLGRRGHGGGGLLTSPVRVRGRLRRASTKACSAASCRERASRRSRRPPSPPPGASTRRSASPSATGCARRTSSSTASRRSSCRASTPWWCWRPSARPSCSRSSSRAPTPPSASPTPTSPSQGIKLEISEAAARRIAAEAARQPRLGARALKEVFRRVVRPLEFDPPNAPGLAEGRLRIELADVERALARGKDDAASSTGGWGAG